MRIAINSQLLFFEKSFRNAGVSRYIYNLIRELAKIDTQNDYFIFVNKTFQPFVNKNNFHFIKSNVNTTKPMIRVFWEQLVLPFLLLKYKIDVFHAAVNILPIFCPVKSVVTVHDLITIECADSRYAKKNVYHNFLSKATKKANKVIAVSSWVKKGMHDYFGVPENKIRVIHEGAAANFRILDKKTVKAFQKKRELNFPFILFVGTLEPRKNIGSLIEAYVLLKKNRKISQKLVIVGGKGWLYDEVFSTIKKHGLENEVVFTGSVDHSELPLYYNAADLFVFPSLHEGFGLPPLEAMQCGCPVIVSNCSSLPEVVGDAAIKINPENVDELADAMKRVMQSSKLRKELAKKGLAQAGKFSWEKAARETLAVYRELYD